MAKTKINLEQNKSTIKQEEEFTLSVALSEVEVAAYTLEIYYDSSIVECISKEEGFHRLENRIIVTGVSETGKNKKLDTILQISFRGKKAGSCVFTAIGEFYNEKGEKLEIGDGEIEIKVTEEENGIKKAQTIPTEDKVEDSNSTDKTNTYLDSLHLSKEGISPDFQKEVTEYYLVVDENTDALEIIATPENRNASLEIHGNTNLQEGENKIEILVTSEDGTKQRKYHIYVAKTKNKEDANANLETLAVENYNLSPEFQANQTQYAIHISNTTDQLNLLAIPNNSGAKVTIRGNENLKEGNNNIEIEVLAPNGITNKTYILKAYKRTKEEEIAYQEQWKNEIAKTEELVQQKNLTDNSNPTQTIEERLEEEKREKELENTEEKQRNIWKASITIGAIVLALLVLGIIIILTRRKKRNA